MTSPHGAGIWGVTTFYTETGTEELGRRLERIRLLQDRGAAAK